MDKKNTALYYILFEDKTKFLGGTNLKNTKWSEIPNKKIKAIFYKMPYNDCIVLSGYDSYYHMVEVVKDLNVKNANTTKIEYTYIMGKKDDEVICYKIAQCKKQKTIKHEIGDVFVKKYNINNEWIKSLNSISWK